MHPEIERRVACGLLGDLAKPRARHHHRAACREPGPRQIEKRAVGAVAHRQIVDMQNDRAEVP